MTTFTYASSCPYALTELGLPQNIGDQNITLTGKGINLEPGYCEVQCDTVCDNQNPPVCVRLCLKVCSFMPILQNGTFSNSGGGCGEQFNHNMEVSTPLPDDWVFSIQESNHLLNQ